MRLFLAHYETCLSIEVELLLCGAYNVIAFARRRERHLGVNAVIDTAGRLRRSACRS